MQIAEYDLHIQPYTVEVCSTIKEHVLLRSTLWSAIIIISFRVNEWRLEFGIMLVVHV